jgi:hypothetical protein
MASAGLSPYESAGTGITLNARFDHHLGMIFLFFFAETHYQVYKKTASLHLCGLGTAEKFPLAFRLFAGTFYCDPMALVLDLLAV